MFDLRSFCGLGAWKNKGGGVQVWTCEHGGRDTRFRELQLCMKETTKAPFYYYFNRSHAFIFDRARGERGEVYQASSSGFRWWICFRKNCSVIKARMLFLVTYQLTERASRWKAHFVIRMNTKVVVRST